MAERIFLQLPGVLVTNARVKIGENTYLLANISSYKTDTSNHTEAYAEKISRWRRFLLKWGGIFGIVVGIFAGMYLESFTKKLLGIESSDLLSGLYAKAAGAVVTFLLYLAALYKLSRKIYFERPVRWFHVKFGTNSGEVNAISSQDENLIKDLVAGLNEAVIYGK